jgi:integrase
VLRQIERRGKYNTVHRLRALISETFSMAIATGRAKGDPSHALRKALVTPKAQRRPAIVEAEPFGQLLRAIDGIEGGAPETRLALQLLSLTFVRPGELRHAEWSEFDLDGEQPTWTIPAAKMKMKREHKVPLSTQAVAIVRELRMLSRGGNYLFPGGRTITRPMSENAMNGVLRRLGYSKDEMCPHGLRSVASTLLNESGLWHRDAIERSLAHIDSDVVRQSYARGEYWDERVKMMQHWADHCDELRANAGVARAA